MKSAKPFTNMSAAELAEATKQYKAMVIHLTRPLGSAERKLLEQAQPGRNRRKIGKGTPKIRIPLDYVLLKKVDDFLRKVAQKKRGPKKGA